jgi:hypothetical protein
LADRGVGHRGRREPDADPEQQQRANHERMVPIRHQEPQRYRGHRHDDQADQHGQPRVGSTLQVNTDREERKQGDRQGQQQQPGRDRVVAADVLQIEGEQELVPLNVRFMARLAVRAASKGRRRKAR